MYRIKFEDLKLIDPYQWEIFSTDYYFNDLDSDDPKLYLACKGTSAHVALAKHVAGKVVPYYYVHTYPCSRIPWEFIKSKIYLPDRPPLKPETLEIHKPDEGGHLGSFYDFDDPDTVEFALNSKIKCNSPSIPIINKAGLESPPSKKLKEGVVRPKVIKSNKRSRIIRQSSQTIKTRYSVETRQTTSKNKRALFTSELDADEKNSTELFDTIELDDALDHELDHEFLSVLDED
jgi:hypothetical protein